MFTQNQPVSMQSRLEIKKFNFFQSIGTTENVVRPAALNVNNQTLSAAMEATRGGTSLNKSSFSHVAPQIMMPSGQHEGSAFIVNGWATPRLVFVMEVDLINEYTNMRTSYIVNGYTDHGDVRTYTGNMSIPREMRLFFNNVITTTQRQEHNVNGVFNVTRVVGSDQILRPNVSALAQGQGIPGVQEQTLRPTDVFNSAIAAETIAHSSYPIHNYTAGFDVGGIKLTSRADHIASNYLSRSIDAYGKVAADRGDQYTLSDIASLAADETNTRLLTHNRLVDLLTTRYDFNDISGGFAGSLTWAEILDIDPQADQRASIFNNDVVKQQELQAQLHTASSWGGGNQETIGANIITSVIPTLMCNAMCGRLDFKASNMTFDRQPVVGIEFTMPVVDNLNITHLLPALQSSIVTDIMMPLSANGLYDVAVTVRAFLYGETRIAISINGQPEQLFVSATYADQLFNNLVTNNPTTPIRLGSDLVTLAHELTHDNTAMFVEQTTMGQQNGYRI